jgi:hypothetical protein
MGDEAVISVLDFKAERIMSSAAMEWRQRGGYSFRKKPSTKSV